LLVYLDANASLKAQKNKRAITIVLIAVAHETIEKVNIESVAVGDRVLARRPVIVSTTRQ